ncbi:hypothetical protein [Paenibacillus terrigena]|uniref:hypothetical protein n=1 Tax=Paenibacillus terrigena TaxID=369333 RepID=UPI0028D04E66|nr:hypothetical protein [Paenibacillus terrigena]
MRINLRILNLSAWIALLTIIIVPGKVYNAGILRTEFGFPFRFFVEYHNKMNESHVWFLRGIRIDLLYFMFDVLIIYGILHGLLYILSRAKK